MEQDNLCISWNSLPWKKFHRKSSSLQRKIYEAKQDENEKSIKRLQKLLLRSKSLYYVAVKRVTDHYSSRGIFLSEKIKLDLVDEIHTKLFKWKHSLIGGNQIIKFIRLSHLKDEVVAYVWNYLMEPVYRQAKRCKAQSFSTKICMKEKRFSMLSFKILLPSSFLRSISFQCLKSVLMLPVKYKFSITRSLTLMTPNFYFRLCLLNFRVRLHFLYLLRVMEVIENLKTYCVLDRWK